MNKYLIVAGIWLASLAAVGYWQRADGANAVQTEWDAEKLTQAVAARQLDAEYRKKEQSLNAKHQEAQNAATERETKLRADYLAAHAAARGLRDTVGDLRRQLSDSTAAACRQTADTALAVLSECADRYRAVAEAADGHASDVRTLIDAWPQ